MKLASQKIDLLNLYFTQKPVVKAYLFGSYARGDADEQSDIDILLELDKDSNLGLMAFSRLIAEIEHIMEAKVDLLSEGGISKHLRPFIEKDKVLIYERR